MKTFLIIIAILLVVFFFVPMIPERQDCLLIGFEEDVSNCVVMTKYLTLFRFFGGVFNEGEPVSHDL